jgi:hypothetical protein
VKKTAAAAMFGGRWGGNERAAAASSGKGAVAVPIYHENITYISILIY